MVQNLHSGGGLGRLIAATAATSVISTTAAIPTTATPTIVVACASALISKRRGL